MASTATAYPNSDEWNRGNPSPEELRLLVKYSGLPSGCRDLILAAFDASDGGPGLILWPAVIGMMIEAGVCRRTVQNRLHRLVNRYKVFEQVREANSWNESRSYFHRPTTYRLNLEKLRSLPRVKELRSDRWRSYKEYKASNRARPMAVPPIRTKPPRPERPAPHVKREGISRAQDRERNLRMELSAKVTTLMKGRHGSVETREGMRFIAPGDPDHSAPMSQENALEEACKQLGIADVEQGRELLKLWHFQSPGEHGP